MRTPQVHEIARRLEAVTRDPFAAALLAAPDSSRPKWARAPTATPSQQRPLPFPAGGSATKEGPFSTGICPPPAAVVEPHAPPRADATRHIVAYATPFITVPCQAQECTVSTHINHWLARVLAVVALAAGAAGAQAGV